MAMTPVLCSQKQPIDYQECIARIRDLELEVETLRTREDQRKSRGAERAIQRQARITSLKTENEALKQRVDDLETKKEILQQRVDDRRKDNEDLKHYYESREQTLHSALLASDNFKNLAQIEQDRLSKALLNSNNKYSQLSQKLSQYNQVLDDNNAWRQERKRLLKERNKLAEAVNEKIADLSDSLTRCKKERDEFLDELNGCKAELVDLHRAFGEQADMMGELDEENATLSSEKAALSEEKAALGGEIAAFFKMFGVLAGPEGPEEPKSLPVGRVRSQSESDLSTVHSGLVLEN